MFNEDLNVGALGVAIAFGFSLLCMAYLIGRISGCHINPAVTIGLAISKKLDKALIPYYIVSQLIGAALGGIVPTGSVWAGEGDNKLRVSANCRSVCDKRRCSDQRVALWSR